MKSYLRKLLLFIIGVLTSAVAMCLNTEGYQSYHSTITPVGSTTPTALYSTSSFPGTTPHKSPMNTNDDDDPDPEWWDNPGEVYNDPIGDIPWVICGLLCGAYIFLSIRKHKKTFNKQ